MGLKYQMDAAAKVSQEPDFATGHIPTLRVVQGSFASVCRELNLS